MAERERPLVTFALFAYNQERFIEEAVAGALAQDYSPLEIILSDDCSPDGTFDIMRRMAADYKGPHRIILNRNERNFGVAGHVNRLIQMVRSQFVVLAAGDDIALPTRTSVSLDGLVKHRVPMIALSTISFFPNGTVQADNVENGVRTITLEGYLSRRHEHPPGASRAFDKELIFDAFGPLSVECPTEDTTLLMRALLVGNVCQLPDIGVRYRRHQDSLSQGHNLQQMKTENIKAQYMDDLQMAQKLKIVSEDCYPIVEKSIDIFFKRRKLFDELARGNSRSKVLLEIILEYDLTIKDKIAAFVIYLKRSANFKLVG